MTPGMTSPLVEGKMGTGGSPRTKEACIGSPINVGVDVVEPQPRRKCPESSLKQALRGARMRGSLNVTLESPKGIGLPLLLLVRSSFSIIQR